MYLTEQGIEAIVIPLYEEFGDECIDPVGEIVKGIEFEPGDFEDTVILTVEEAKNLMRILYDNAEHLDCLYESSKDDYLFLEEISNRIEQVEGK
jgi:hypothetical protein